VVILYTTLFESSFEMKIFFFVMIWGFKIKPFFFGESASRSLFYIKARRPLC
jgi:hypothetical protein